MKTSIMTRRLGLTAVSLGIALAGIGYADDLGPIALQQPEPAQKMGGAAIERVVSVYGQNIGQADLIRPALERSREYASRLRTENGIAVKVERRRQISLDDTNPEFTPASHGGGRGGDIASCERERDYCISHRCPPTGRDGSRTCRNQCKAEFGWCVDQVNRRSRCDSELDYCISHRCPPTGRDGSRTCRNQCKEEHRRCQGW